MLKGLDIDRVKIGVIVFQSRIRCFVFLLGGHLSNGYEASLVEVKHVNLANIFIKLDHINYFFLFGSQIQHHYLFSFIKSVDHSF